MNILFVTQDASRTGAPMVLLHLMKWLKEHTDVRIQLLCKIDGPLVADFAQFAPVHLWDKPRQGISFFKNPYKRIQMAIRPQKEKEDLLGKLKAAEFDIIYLNTVAIAEVMQELRSVLLGIPMICHVHELAYAIWANGEQKFGLIQKNVQHFIAASEAVKQNLLNTYGIAHNAIDTVHEWVPSRMIASNISKDVSDLRSQLNIAENTFVVGFSGTPEWRKGTDLFLPLVQECLKQGGQDLLFIWVGAKVGSHELYQLEYDVHKLGLASSVRIVASVPKPLDYFALFHCFVLLSREDPFPLVCIETAALGLPIICFEGAGGIPELVEEDAGYQIPYLRLDLLAEKLLFLQQNPEKAKAMGEAAKEKVVQRYDVQVQCPKVLRLLESLVPKN